MLGYLSLDIICSSKLTVFPEFDSQKNVCFSEQIISMHISTPLVEAIAPVSEPEANERGSSLIGKRSHCRGLEHVFAKRKELW